MSKYSIYRIDHPDPALLGRQRRRMNVYFFLTTFLIYCAFLVLHFALNVSFPVSYLPMVLIILTLTFLYYMILRSRNRKMMVIGNIEFSTSGVIKHLGDSSSSYPYETISSIELNRHIPAINAAETKSGYSTHILTIVFNDSSREIMVISDRPVGKYNALGITDTLGTLKKIITTEIKIS
ncbi:MAG: hypothetical protein U0X39_05920 [Bacteroidales bacterium]